MKQAIIILSLILSFTFFSKAQNFNCDSLKRQFEAEIANAKKNGADKQTLDQLEAIKKQTIDMFCNSSKMAAPEYAGKSTSEKPALSKVGKSSQFKGAFSISLNIEAYDAETPIKAIFDYAINKEGNQMLIDQAGLSKAGKLAEQMQQEDGTLDAWIIEQSGKSTFYVTSKEEGKIALISNLQPYMIRPTSKAQIKVTALKQKRKIAGYDCTAFKVSGQDNGEKFDLTCWVTNQALPFKHANFPMFSMMNAGPLGIPGNPLRAILAFEGSMDNKPMKISVSKITPNNQTTVLSGYKILTTPTMSQ
ncbi:hypothetical protein [Sediminibacterium sp.]|uniref:hypothetical protein n=1 Tax=Sediminibacterium sp. TaxID=1917865 RepID=UPI003F723D69